MFNPEKLLGGLLNSGIGKTIYGSSKNKAKSLMTGTAAIGLLGVAMEAFEHFTKNQGVGTQSAPPPQPGPAYRPVQAPPAPPQPGLSSAPPSVPHSVYASAPPVAPLSSGVSGAPVGASGTPSEAVLLIKAMIAAANSDGVIDSEERASILEKLRSVGLSSEEESFIMHELLAPAGIDEIVRHVADAATARHVYMASLMAVSVDTESEREYLRALAQRLGLTDSDVSAMHAQMEVAI